MTNLRLLNAGLVLMCAAATMTFSETLCAQDAPVIASPLTASALSRTSSACSLNREPRASSRFSGSFSRSHGVTLDDCQRVSEQIGALLDVEDPLPGSYVLEVSSPGFDRRLRKLAHFERFRGENAKIELKDARDGRRRFTGRLVGVEGSEVLLEVDGELTRLPFDDIAVARLAPS